MLSIVENAIKSEGCIRANECNPLASRAKGAPDVVDDTTTQRLRLCKRCGEAKSPDSFGKMPGAKDGRLANVCKACRKIYQRAWIERNRAFLAMSEAEVQALTCNSCKETKGANQFGARTGRKYGKDSTCLQCRRLYDRARYARSPQKRIASAKWSGVKWRFGLTEAECAALHESQNGRCAICREEILLATGEVGSVASACIDHDHKTGTVRGLLCRLCNQGIGLLRDSSTVAQAAAAYLRKHGK